MLPRNSPGIPELQALCRLCVPAFIILSAYFAELSRHSAEGWRYHASRIRALLIPFVVWSLVYFLIEVDWSTLTPTQFFTRHLGGFGWAGQYFFIILIQIILLFPLLQMLAGNKWTAWGSIVITVPLFAWLGYFPNSLPHILQTLSLRPAPYWFAYAIIGILAARQKLTFFPAWTLLVLAFFPFESRLLVNAGIDSDFYLRPVVFLGSSVITLAFLSKNRFEIAKITWIRRSVEIIAPNTMGIFVLNPLFTIALGSKDNPFAQASVGLSPLLLSVMLAILVFCCSLATTLLAKRLHGGWLFGKA